MTDRGDEAMLKALDEAILRGLADAKAGRTRSAEEVFARLELKYRSIGNDSEVLPSTKGPRLNPKPLRRPGDAQSLVPISGILPRSSILPHQLHMADAQALGDLVEGDDGRVALPFFEAA